MEPKQLQLLIEITSKAMVDALVYGPPATTEDVVEFIIQWIAHNPLISDKTYAFANEAWRDAITQMVECVMEYKGD